MSKSCFEITHILGKAGFSAIASVCAPQNYLVRNVYLPTKKKRNAHFPVLILVCHVELYSEERRVLESLFFRHVNVQ
jgi:hypothetical protein